MCLAVCVNMCANKFCVCRDMIHVHICVIICICDVCVSVRLYLCVSVLMHRLVLVCVHVCGGRHAHM